MLDFPLGNLEEIFQLDWGSVEPEGEFGEVSEYLQLDLVSLESEEVQGLTTTAIELRELGVVVHWWCQNKTRLKMDLLTWVSRVRCGVSTTSGKMMPIVSPSR
jgi:hypothetical protein